MVVYDENTGIEYFFMEKGGTTWTKETVTVINPTGSSLKAGSTVTVVEQVGVISIYDYVNSMSDKLKTRSVDVIDSKTVHFYRAEESVYKIGFCRQTICVWRLLSFRLGTCIRIIIPGLFLVLMPRLSTF